MKLAHTLRSIHIKSSFRPNSVRSLCRNFATNNTVSKTVKLNDGSVMPTLALGTWKSEPEVVREAVASAIEAGYRHIDCAAIYGNERNVGEGIAEGIKRVGNIKREDLFITSKLWNTEHSPDRILPACDQTIHDLGVKYLDLYLIHWPISFKPGTKEVDDSVELYETWEAMQILKNEELVKSLGVSNFNVKQLESLMEETDFKPAVNQVELHPYLSQPKLAAFAAKNSIQLTAYSPLGTGKNSTNTDVLIEDPTIHVIAERYKKTPAQILLRWSLQSGFCPLPKSVTPSRIKENFNVYDFSLGENEMNMINKLNKNSRYVKPEWASHFAE